MIRTPQDVAAGLFLIALAAIAAWQSAELSLGTKAQFGPGMLPLGLATLTGLIGLGILVGAFFQRSPQLDRWSLRGILFVLGAAVVFGLTVRPLGLAVAAPAAIVICSLASNETRFVEIAVYALILSAFCVGLFRYALGLPIPVAPWLLGY